MIPRHEMTLTDKPYKIDEKNYERYPVTNQAFATVSYKDTGDIGLYLSLNKMMDTMISKMQKGVEGRKQENNALDMGANSLNLILGNYGKPNSQLLKWQPLFTPEMMQKNKVNYKPEKLSEMVKEAAFLYGADLIGITDLNPKWVFSQDMVKPYVIKETDEPRETEGEFVIPKSMNKAIVMAVAMNDEMTKASPSVKASVTTAIGYSRMGITAVALAEYIRGLGYNAIPAMNDTALSIPLAVDAGLGQLGRLGILITPEYGPNVRLFKVITDMPLENDKPIDFGVVEFCKNCYLCAESCPSGAISFEEPTFEPACDNNNPGVEKWPIKSEECLRFWQENGASCSNCIAACPFIEGYKSTMCIECEDCRTRCVLQTNTFMRKKYGYLDVKQWGGESKVLYPRRKGL
jgi:reductive dehalogenase